eukprot:g3735.t1
MATPMCELPFVSSGCYGKKGTRVEPVQNIKELDTDDVLKLAQEYRVFSDKHGDDEFAIYAGVTFPNGKKTISKKVLADAANVFGFDPSATDFTHYWLTREPLFAALQAKPTTTTQVCECVVKPRTLESGCSYARMLLRQQDERKQKGDGISSSDVGEPTLFISHAWRYPFEDLVQCLDDYYKDKSPMETANARIWNDVFVEDQNNSFQKSPDYWYTSFKQAIGHIGHTLLVLSPWSAPVALSRSWCVWEIYSTIATKSELYIAMPSRQTNSFRKALCRHSSCIVQALSNVDAKHAEAFCAKAQARILRTIENSVGVSAVNRLIGVRRRKWLNETALVLLEEEKAKYNASSLAPTSNATEQRLADKTKTSYARTLHQVAVLLDGSGDPKRAEALFREAYDIRKELSNDKFTLYTANSLATNLCNQNRLDEAESLHRKIVGLRESTFGADHKDTLVSKNNLGYVLLRKGALDEAERLYRYVLKKRHDVFGAEGKSTLFSANGLGQLLLHKKQYTECEKILSETLAKRERVLGPRHPSTLTTARHLGRLCIEIGNYIDAETLLLRAYKGRCEVLGEEIYETQACYSDLQAIEELHRHALETAEKSFGPKDERSLICVRRLSRHLSSKGDHEKAESLLRRDMVHHESTCGPEHVNTLHCATELAKNLSSQRNFEESTNLLRLTLKKVSLVPRSDT